MPDPEAFERADFGNVANVPVLLDSNQVYRREANRYLRERALLKWHPSKAFDTKLPRRRPSSNTLLLMANSLKHFLDWCELTGRKWENVPYQAIEDYQRQQLSGRAPNVTKKLSATTVNLRADDATFFLVWAAYREFRPEFPISLTESTHTFTNATTGRSVTVTGMTRTDRAKTLSNKTSAVLEGVPEVDEIIAWLRALRLKRGRAKYLICRFMVETGVRLDEAVSLEVDDWPKEAVIGECLDRVHHLVHLVLTKTKGGQPRRIAVPVRFARLVLDWIEGRRDSALSDWKDANPGKTETTRLFVSDFSGFKGIPIQRHTVGDCFSEVKPRPAHWHPHMARHAYACHHMRDVIEEEAGGNAKGEGAAWLQSRSELALDEIRRQLGHLSSETTEIYLRHLRMAVGLTVLTDRFHKSLERSEDDA